MQATRTITLYLHPDLRKQAVRGSFNFVNRIKAAVEPRGYKLAFRGGTLAPRIESLLNPGYALFHMEDPFHPRALTMRKVYHFPFWAIENTSKRWEWAVAEKPFDPESVDPIEAKAFVNAWRTRLFSEFDGGPSGHIYVPLQGRLSQHRSFQTASPFQMLEDVLEYANEQAVIATLHPREAYSPSELAHLEMLADAHPNLSVTTGEMEKALPGAEFVVTQNSSAAFNGFFFKKPAILYGKIDFHHIGLNVHDVPVAESFARIREHRPDFERYLFWFWQENCINAGREDAEAKILGAFRRGGWDI